jgi:C1A family cysteine protease
MANNPKQPQPALGRLPSRHTITPCELKTRYAMPDMRREAEAVSYRYWLSRGVAYDQGDTSQCVAYSGVRYLITHPICNKPLPFKPLYTECQRSDEWSGEEPEYEGTSVRALFVVLKRRGLVSEYRWGSNAETVVAHLLTRGPVVMGTDWTREMFMPDRWGYITDDGPNEGGHAYLLIGANRKKVHPLTGEVGAVRLINSWGPNWGAQAGKAWMSFATLERLIKADGEAAVATEIKAV